MVCKEDVLLWFKDLESYKRIDVMYELLNMCIPFEVRFLGSCIEEIGKHTFQELRGPTIIANDVERLSKDPTLHMGLLDETTRHRAVIYMSVLSGRNCSCANWFYRTLFRTDRIENYVNGFCNDDNILSELLLLFTLGLYHPAYTFEQKLYFGRLLEKLISQQEGNKFISPMNFLPRLLCSARNIPSVPIDSPIIPVKSSSIMPGGDTVHIQHPPGLPLPQHAMPHPMDFLPAPMITRTGFPATIVGAPEVHPFPPQPVSPLISQAASPPQSRAPSPHRTYNMRPLPASGLPTPPPGHNAAPPGHTVDAIIVGVPPLHLEPPLQKPSLPFNSPDVVPMKNNEDDNKLIQDDKMRESSHWMNQQAMIDSMKQHQPNNGIRVPTFQKYQTFIAEQMQGLKLEGDNSLHCSSSASSNSSINQSPPETPSVTPAVTPHGPGRGSQPPQQENKPRANGMPQFICDINAPPPPPFSNCSVPSFQIAHVQPNSYFSMHPTLPPRNQNPNCYNCGGVGHAGVDCNGHTVEDITQKPYMLEYDSSTAVPDNNPPPPPPPSK